MVDEEDFFLWVNENPSTVSYSEAVDFIAEYDGVNNAKAEVALARMNRDDKIEIIKTRRTSTGERRVFTHPLPDLTRGVVREVHDGEYTEMDLEKVVNGIRDRTGHDEETIVEFLTSLDDVDTSNERFRWDNEA